VTVTFSGVVLTGGRSNRLGRDKATLAVGGVPLASRAFDALKQAGAGEVLSVGGNRAALTALGFDARADDHPGEGPLGGVLTGLRLARHPVAVVLACDLPYVDQAGVLQVLTALTDDVDAAVPELEGRLDPLHAAYRTAGRPALSQAFAHGERAVHRALARLRVARVAVDRPLWLTNINTLRDLASVEGWHDGPVDVPQIDIDEMARRRADGTMVLDVRQPDEYEAGHVPGAHLIPLGEVAQRIGEIPEGAPVLVVCHSGGRSRRAAEFLRAQGRDATNVAGGTAAWIEAGQPVAAGPQPG
jgi:molybdopterin-guanine dinucleotide biosynthesis protein A/rhodanese-related sulfurtransferase